MNDPTARLSVLHVIVRAGPTNSQYNEHVLPMLDERRITVCSLFPAAVVPPAGLTLFEGDGSTRGCFKALRRALAFRDYDIVHVHAPASGVLTLAVYALARRSREDLVFTVHNSWKNFRRRNRLFLRMIIALFPMVVLCGRAAYDSLPARIRRRHGPKIEVVQNGVDLERIDAVLKSPHAERPGARPRGRGRTVVSTNRLIPLKDPETLLDAFTNARRLSDDLVLVGDGSLRRKLERAARRRGLERHVKFTGIVSRDEVYRTLSRADVFVSTSRGEGLPVALLEAMGCGCPVVVSDIAPHREIAMRTEGIPLVPVHDAAGFSRALARMLAMSPDERRALGRQLRACVAEHFSVPQMNRGYTGVYRKALAVRRGERVAQQSAELSFLDRLRRRAGLVVVLALLGGAGGYVYAQTERPEFRAETSVLVGGGIGAPADDDALKASIAYAARYADLARREPVLGPVAARGFANDWRELQNDVNPQIADKNPQLITFTVNGETAEGARRLAVAVGRQLERMAGQDALSPQQEFLQEQRRALEDQIAVTSAALDQAQQRLDEPPAGEDPRQLRSQVDDLRRQLVDFQGSYVELQSALQGSDVGHVQVVEEAWVAATPIRPAPLLLVLAGIGVGMTLAAGWVHLFDTENRRSAAHVRATGNARRREHDALAGNSNGHMPPDPWAEPETLWETTPIQKKGLRS